MLRTRHLLAGVLLVAAACESQTFDLLKPDDPVASEGGAGGEVVESKGGTGGAGRAAGGAAGNGGHGQIAGSPTGGAVGIAGGGPLEMAGEGGESAGPRPCTPPFCPECEGDDDCDAPLRFCVKDFSGVNRCVACGGDGDCNDPLSFCVKDFNGVNRCVACRKRYDCEPYQACDPNLHFCVPACDADDCKEDPRWPACNPESGLCDCTADSQCATHVCLQGNPEFGGTCVECVTDRDCGPSGLLCGDDLRCHCSNSAQCEEGRACTYGRCVDTPPPPPPDAGT